MYLQRVHSFVVFPVHLWIKLKTSKEKMSECFDLPTALDTEFVQIFKLTFVTHQSYTMFIIPE